MKRFHVGILICWSALAGYVVGASCGQPEASTLSPSAEYYRTLYWQALGDAADAKENPEKWTVPAK